MGLLQVGLMLFAMYANIDANADPCPHQTPGLRRWSNSSQWANKQKPVADEDVVISDGVLFDDITPRLRTITIKPTGRLVWSPSGDYHLTVSTVLIEGRLDIGAEDCMFDAKARITLIGDRDTAPRYTEDNDQKGIILMPGGTLEIHGKQKLSWTKLNSTLPKSRAVFDHKVYTTEEAYPNLKHEGLYVYVFEPSSAKLVEFKPFRTTGQTSKNMHIDFQNYIESVTGGNIIMVASERTMFTQKLLKDSIYAAVETLLGSAPTVLRSAVPESNDAYAMFAVKGDTSKSQEVLISTNTTVKAQSAELTYLDWDNGYKYKVGSYYDNVQKSKSGASFTVISIDRAFPVLNLIDDTSSWRPGDRVVLTSTDYDWKQAEEGTLIECLQCSPTQVRIDLEVQYVHWGEITDGVDMRGEVALLNRSILIEGEVQDSCPPANGNCHEYDFDTFGGHLKVHRTGFNDVHIEGAEFYHMGQQTDKGHYPIHFHMCENVSGYANPPYVRDNSIHDSFARCITVHGTHGLKLQDNVGYKAMGHCFFLEDGGEHNTVFDGNLGGSIQAGSLIPTDGANNFSVFWITSPLTYMRNNVAAGSEANGIWYVFPEEPMDLSNDKGWFKPNEARRTKITEFTNNVAHSCSLNGLRMDNKLQPDGTVPRGDGNDYEAREDPLDENSPLVEVYFHRATMYKNGKQNTWIRGLWMSVNESGFSDSARGLTFGGGDDSRMSASYSIILGDSPNQGEPWTKGEEFFPRSSPLMGQSDIPLIGYYQYGTPALVYNTWFNYFGSTAKRFAGAIGFARKTSKTTSPLSSLRNLDWGFDDGVGLGNRFFDGDENDNHFSPKEDGDKTHLWRDVDGTSAGRAGVQVLPPRPFHLTDKCHVRQNWKLAACPYKYGKIHVKVGPQDVAAGSSPFMMRDDLTTVKEERALQSTDFAVILGGLYSYTLHWTTSTPNSFMILARAVEKDYPVRIGICLPRDAKFELARSKPFKTKWEDWIVAGDISEIDNDDTGKKYFWDSTTGLLFVKMQHDSALTDNGSLTACAADACDRVWVTLINGTKSDSDCSSRAYGPYAKTIVDPTSKLTLPDVMPKTKSSFPEGYGAGPTRPFRTRDPVNGGFGQWTPWGPCSVPCGGGKKVKTRACDNPIPQHGGLLCDGDRIMIKTCNTGACKIRRAS